MKQDFKQQDEVKKEKMASNLFSVLLVAKVTWMTITACSLIFLY